jgi:orotidine-5'-phosphate decarboxylase
VVTDRIVVGLDLPSAAAALDVAEAVRDHVAAFKVGIGLLYAEGPQLIGRLNDLGRPVFADAKLHDIPSQVEAAARHLGEHGARWVTAHVSGGSAMLEAAVAGLATGNPGAGILGVTVLTSLDAAQLAAIGIGESLEELVARMAAVAGAAGCEGVVSSPREVGSVGAAAPGLLRVTPGIRIGPGHDDQARTATPAEAVAAGADLIVVGRPITLAADPTAAAAEIEASLRSISIRQ